MSTFHECGHGRGGIGSFGARENGWAKNTLAKKKKANRPSVGVGTVLAAACNLPAPRSGLAPRCSSSRSCAAFFFASPRHTPRRHRRPPPFPVRCGPYLPCERASDCACSKGNATVDQDLCDPFSGCEWFGATVKCQSMDFCGFPTQAGCAAHTGCAWNAANKQCNSVDPNNPYNDYDNVCQISAGVRSRTATSTDPREQGGCQPRAVREQPGRQWLPVEAWPGLH